MTGSVAHIFLVEFWMSTSEQGPAVSQRQEQEFYHSLPWNQK